MFGYGAKSLGFTLKLGRVFKYALRMNYKSPTQNVQNNS